MPSIQVKGVPDHVHTVLSRRAAAAGQSLQQYVLAILSEQAETPTVEEAIALLGRRQGGHVSPKRAAAVVRADRDSH